MSLIAKNTKVTIVPCLRYRNAAAAIEWLCASFGFKKHAVYAGANGAIAHAELTFGNGMIMVGTADESGSEWGRLIRQPDQVDGAETQSAYLVAADADIIYKRAKEAGAQIVLEIKDEEYGGRGFTCRDLEGHIWTFGTYDPWQQDDAGANP